MSKYYDPKEHAEFDLEFIKVEYSSGVTEKEYRASAGLNQSFLKDINEVSPFDAEYKQTNPEKPTPAMKIGSLMHCMALTPEEIDAFVISPEYDARTTAGKAIRDEFLAQSVGKVVLKPDEWALADSMAKALKPHIPSFPKGSPNTFIPEAVLYGEAVVTGGPFKGMQVAYKGKLDGLCLFNVRDPQGTVRIYDLKSVADIGDISGASYKSGWATQAALYSDLAETCFQRPSVFEYDCVSKEPPFGVRKAVVSHEMVLKGRKAYKDATSKWLWYINNGRPKTDQFFGIETLNG